MLRFNKESDDHFTETIREETDRSSKIPRTCAKNSYQIVLLKRLIGR